MFFTTRIMHVFEAIIALVKAIIDTLPFAEQKGVSTPSV